MRGVRHIQRMTQVENLVEILKNYKGSSFEPVKEELITRIEKSQPNMPGDLKELYRTLGYGCIGDSRYMIHVPMEPTDIYDKNTAKDLNGILIVGDDFAGNFEAYGNETSNFIRFLTEWFVDKENA